MTLTVMTVQEIREGMRILDIEDVGRRKPTIIMRVDLTRCRNKVHLNDMCYDRGYPVYRVTD